MILEFKEGITLEIRESGDRYWFNSNGELHREDGPAIEYHNGGKEYYENGWLHRIGRPAIEFTKGIRFWYLRGKQYSEYDYWEKLCSGGYI